MPQRPLEIEKVLSLKRFYRRERRLPSYAEMARLFGFASKNAAFRLAGKLIEAGYIEKGPAGHLVPNPDKFGTPLLGTVQAGFPSAAEEELLDTITLDNYLVEKPEASFLLEVSGDSMIEAGILPGDLVIIERGANPKNGSIVLAQVDREWTLKYYQKRGDNIELIPANPKYPIIKPKEELTIAGIVRAVTRRY